MRYPVDKNDVWVDNYVLPDCDSCMTSTGDLKTVIIDHRAIGTGSHLGNYCAECLPSILKSLRDSLPEGDPDDGMDDRAIEAKRIADSYVEEDEGGEDDGLGETEADYGVGRFRQDED